MERNRKETEYFASRRMVVKIGSSTITRDGDPLNLEFMDYVARQVSELFKNGIQVTIVSSGAVACGRKLLSSGLGKTILDNQRRLYMDSQN